MTEPLPRSVIEPANPKLNVSRNANLPHSPGIRVGDYIFLSGMGPVDPITGGRNLGHYDEMNRVWREFFPVDPPARTTCALQLSNGNGVEIECIALAGKSPS